MLIQRVRESIDAFDVVVVVVVVVPKSVVELLSKQHLPIRALLVVTPRIYLPGGISQVGRGETGGLADWLVGGLVGTNSSGGGSGSGSRRSSGARCVLLLLMLLMLLLLRECRAGLLTR